MNLPNLITSARIALVPLMVLLLLSAATITDWQRWLALVVFVLAISTDGIDGALARKTNRVTNLGKILDPIADKSLIVAALVTLSLLAEVPWWITAVIVIRELAVTIHRLAVVKKEIIAANDLGKLKTILQGIAIGVTIAPFEIWFGPWSQLELLLLYLALVATVVSGIQYIRAALGTK